MKLLLFLIILGIVLITSIACIDSKIPTFLKEIETMAMSSYAKTSDFKISQADFKFYTDWLSGFLDQEKLPEFHKFLYANNYTEL